jgi:hypothetical protein
MQGKCALLECMASYEASSSPPADVARKRPISEQIRHSDGGCLLPAFRHTMGVVQTAVWLGGACLGVLTGDRGDEEAGPSNYLGMVKDTRTSGPRCIGAMLKGRKSRALPRFGPCSTQCFRLKCYSHD